MKQNLSKKSNIANSLTLLKEFEKKMQKQAYRLQASAVTASEETFDTDLTERPDQNDQQNSYSHALIANKFIVK